MSYEGYSGFDESMFMDVQTARKFYDLSEHTPANGSDLYRSLVTDGIAQVQMPITENDFKSLTFSYETCLDQCHDIMPDTYHEVDKRFGFEAGNMRKEYSRDPETGFQLSDGKDIFHLNEHAYARWEEQFRTGPKALKEFIVAGHEIHMGLLAVMQGYYLELEDAFPHITESHFPQKGPEPRTMSFLRVAAYDEYEIGSIQGEVAKIHPDLSHTTLHGYADAPGFYVLDDNNNAVLLDTPSGYGYFFMGMGHRKLYGTQSALKPKKHAVGRIEPVGVRVAPKRHAVILFGDAPFIDYGIKKHDIFPHLHANPDEKPTLQPVNGY